MKTLLVPVDFTKASQNAVDFAAEWSRKYLYERIILLRSFYTSMYEGAIMSEGFANVDQDYLNNNRQLKEKHLENICKILAQKTGTTIKVQSAVTELPLVRGIMEVIKKENPAMILAGSDQENNDNESVISGNVISIAKISPVRVLIIPEHYHYKEIRKCLVPCNFDAVDSLDKVNILHSTPQWQEVQLMVLNVDAKQKHLNPDGKFKTAENALHEYLKNFHHKIYYVADKNVINGILNFTKSNEVEMLIALPGKYSFLYSLTHKNISEALYRNTKIPVMIMK